MVINQVSKNYDPELFIVIAQVKVLYVRNLMLTTSEQLIQEAFSYHAPVERVKKIRDYAFVHFESREGAMKALRALNGKNEVIEKCSSNCTLFVTSCLLLLSVV